LPFKPYLYLIVEEDGEKDIISDLDRDSKVQSIRVEEKVDLEMPGHLSGLTRKCLRLEFATLSALNQTRAQIQKMLARAKSNKSSYQRGKFKEDYLVDMREHDVMLHARASIDSTLRVGKWFELAILHGHIIEIKEVRKEVRPPIRVMAFDIETSKKPLRFPDADKDQIMMISLMEKGGATLIVNRAFCGESIPPFRYEPPLKPEFDT
jgi:DNA polymerase epsilon subunit 1